MLVIPLEQEKGKEMQPARSVRLDNDIEKANLKETTSGVFLNIRYKDNTGETHKLTARELEGFRAGRYSVEMIANGRAALHRENNRENNKSKSNSLTI